jgi:anti-sigma factor RsiW
MKHPNRATLALHAGGDLGPWARWRAQRHLAQCPECRAEIAAFEAAREIIPELAAIPEVPWNRMAARMKANIRLGLTLGELAEERAEKAPHGIRAFAWSRPAAAFACVAALVMVGLVLQRNDPRMAARAFQGAEVETTADGIQVREGGAALGLLHVGAQASEVNYTPGAQGAMTAQNVDDTGHVTVTNVYAN